MLIELQEPFRSKWNKGYLRLSNENRRILDLYNNDYDRTTISYARYLMGVKLGYEVPLEYEVDHRDNDRTNDDINNYQRMTGTENRKKQFKEGNNSLFGRNKMLKVWLWSPGGEIGRHKRLKIFRLWVYQFESGPGHHNYIYILKSLAFGCSDSISDSGTIYVFYYNTIIAFKCKNKHPLLVACFYCKEDVVICVWLLL